MYKLIAGIAVYNPDIEQLKINVNALIGQVPKIILVDNNSINQEIIKRTFSDPNIEVICLETNNGTAGAFNVLFDYAKRNNYEWCLTMDQDSICDLELIKKNQEYLKQLSIALISPQIVYSCDISFEKKNEAKTKEIEFAIASGSLVNVERAIEIGGYDEKIFLDYADFDFCIRLRKSGGRIIFNPNSYIIHNLGDLRKKKIWGKDIYITNHGENRRYYYAKNLKYVQQKHSDLISKQYVKRRLALKALVILLFEKRKYRKIRALIQGYQDGILMEGWKKDDKTI